MATDQTQSAADILASGIADDTISITSSISDSYWTSNLNTVWTTTGTNGTSSGFQWPNSPATTNSATLELNGDNADIKVNGRSLMDAIDTLEQRLNILVPNPKLEAEWDELRELGDRYRELERKCQEKGNMWAKLKSLDDTNR